MNTTSLKPTTSLLGATALSLGLAFGPALGALAQEIEPHVVDSRPATFADLAEQVSPAVVNITTTTTVAGGDRPTGVVPEGSPFEDFFRDFQDRQGEGPRRSSALGSGFVISADGYIVTNNHVIEGADEIQIEFYLRRHAARPSWSGTDPNTDIALLKVETRRRPALRRVRRQRRRRQPGRRLGHGDGQPAGPGLLGLGRDRLGAEPGAVGHL